VFFLCRRANTGSGFISFFLFIRALERLIHAPGIIGFAYQHATLDSCI
jgi:hypothetical protein